MAAPIKNHWKLAARKTKYLTDPWENLGFDTLQEKSATRHVYNPVTKEWWKDNIMIKIEDKPFAKGAMRECYRMKKLSKFSHQPDWKHASNYVAKRYMSEQPYSIYLQDVQLQMDSKMWGDKYNKRNPPKKVDFFQAYLIELKEEECVKVFCVEHFIEGNYVKYNSNSGFVSELHRLTPHAFSHFTFEKSRHQLIVVDIQGVGDLYTDPQMHTMDLSEYGDANLGAKGMALFFSSHLCSPLCFALGLTQFDLSQEELSRLSSNKWSIISSETVVSPSITGSSDITKLNSTDILPLSTTTESVSEAYQRIKLLYELNPLPHPPLISEDSYHSLESPIITPEEFQLELKCGRDEETNVYTNTEKSCDKKSRKSSSVKQEIQLAKDIKQVKETLHLLGQVHYEMSVYHSIGRFTDYKPDIESGMHHLKKAAQCGVTKALYLLGCIYQQLPHQQLEQFTVESNPTNECLGFEYFLEAAENGLRVAMVIVAKTFETGVGLGLLCDSNNGLAKHRTQDWKAAVQWYEKALETTPTPSCDLDESAPDEPEYSILAHLAQMYNIGGYGLSIDLQTAGDYYQKAADVAMEMMKGKLANKYYMLAEEAWSIIQ